MIGVNVEDVTDDANMNDGQSIESDISSVMSETSFSDISNGNLESLTTKSAKMDHQTAGVSSVFGMGGDMSLNSALFGRLAPSNSMVASAAKDAANKDVQNSLALRAVGNPNGSANDPVKVTSTINNYIDEELLSDVKEWLVTIIPKLNGNDVDEYARGLSGIGFHPECVTMCELNYDDLDFMKVLHRRYLFNEITGIEHPWEA